jgi:hypothetical protein
MASSSYSSSRVRQQDNNPYSHGLRGEGEGEGEDEVVGAVQSWSLQEESAALDIMERRKSLTNARRDW